LFQRIIINQMLKQIRTTLVLLLFLCMTESIFSQHIFVSNLYNNLVFSNPSLAGINKFSLLQLNYRNQWPIDGIYNTYGVSYFHSMEKLNSNIGAIFNYDRQYKGFLTNTSLGANYTYKLQVGRRNYLYFGLAGHYHLQKLNYNVLTFENAGTTMPENQSSSYPIINTGVTLSLNEVHYFGASATNVIPLADPLFVNQMITLSYIAHIEGASYYSLPSFYEPIAAINLTKEFIEFKYGCNLGFYNVRTGILFSQTGMNINTMDLLLGIIYNNYEFIYTYGLNLSGAVTINPKIAAHEVTFLVKFQYKRRRTRKGAIKCPDI
jgi:type IX secretion system PorP/SprF family membrane protein